MKNERISEVTTKYIESKDSKKCVAGYFLRGNEYYKLGMYENAVQDYTSAIQLNQKLFNQKLAKKIYSAHFHNRGNAYLMLNDFKKAEKDYKKEISLNLEFDEAYLNLAKVQYALGKFEKSKSNFEKALEISRRGQYIKAEFVKFQSEIDKKIKRKQFPKWMRWTVKFTLPFLEITPPPLVE